MESPTTAPNTNPTSAPLSYEDAPLLNLLSRSLSEMSTDELRSHVQELREVSSSSVTLRKKINMDKAEAKPTKKADESKKLINKYLNM